jgi:hypothetical protein
VIGLLATAALWSQPINVTDVRQEMGIELCLPENMEMAPVVDQKDIEYQTAFRLLRSCQEITGRIIEMSI